MIEHSVKTRVRYADTDQMGYVYYGKYAVFYEIARTELLRKLGLSYRKLEEAGFMMPVLSVESHYKAPAYYDEELTLKVYLKDMPLAKISFYVDVLNEEGKLIHQGITTLAFVNAKTRKPCRCPELLRNIISPYFQ